MYTRCVSVIPQGGVLEGYASGAQGPVGALSEAREYEDRCVHSSALGSLLKAAWAAFPRGIHPGKACNNHTLHRKAPRPVVATASWLPSKFQH